MQIPKQMCRFDPPGRDGYELHYLFPNGEKRVLTVSRTAHAGQPARVEQIAGRVDGDGNYWPGEHSDALFERFSRQERVWLFGGSEATGLQLR